MPAPSDNTSSSDVTALAVRLNLLSATDAEHLRDSSEKEGVPPLQAALRTGLLSAEAIDIVETLLRPHEAVPGYEMLDLLGRGGMGVVYRARQVALNRIVAVKTIRVGRMADEGSVARFEQEARTIAQLRHPNIVGAFDFGRHGGRLFLAMEYVDGNNAEAFVQQQGPLPERTVWSLVRQAASGLAHAWSRRIVHRDVKPANLLLIDKPEGFPLPPGIPLVMIADFGLAQLSDMIETKTRLTAENVTVGSPPYMSPEQLQSSEVDFHADLYSLGASALHLLTGEPPLHLLNLSQLITRKLTAASIVDGPEFRDRFSPPTQALLRRMTARHSQDRPVSYAALIDEIDQLPMGLAQVGSGVLAGRSLPTVILPTEPMSRHSASTVDVRAALAVTADSIPEATDSPTSLMFSVTGGGSTARAETFNGQAHRARFPGQRVILAAAIVLTTAAAIGSWMIWRERSRTELGMLAERQPLQRSPVKDTDFSTYVFNGINVSNFHPISGSWIVPRHSSVIEGIGGSLSMHLVRRGKDQQPVPLNYYRLEVLVELREAKAAWVEFAIAAPVSDSPGPSWALKLQGSQAQLVRRDDSTAPWESAHSARPIDPGMKHVLLIERNPAGWFLKVDDVAAGCVPLAELPERPEFRLGVEGGPAWFSDLLVTETQSTTSDAVN